MKKNMGKDNYRIIIPFTQSQDLELTTRLLDKQSESIVTSSHFELQKEATTGETIYIPSLEYPLPDEKVPVSMLQVLKSTQQAFSHILSSQCTFLVATATGFQLVKPKHIFYFEYVRPKKQWVLILTDQTCLLLKRNTVANDILEFSPALFRISHQYIINLNHLKAIEGVICKFSFPTPNNQELKISRGYFKALQESLRMI
jgi:DNA-binding LytR/AlgR family response regulator